MSVITSPSERNTAAAGDGASGDFDPSARPPLVLHNRTMGDVTSTVSAIIEGRTPRWWWPAFLLSATVALVGVAMILYLAITGVGVWGMNQPVGWAWDITNFVFWVGIGHAGTLISAILFLLRQKWRTSINRAAEAMTIFAVVCAGIFPLIHVGRMWRIYFVAPVPNHLDIWPNFRSPLLWDAFAVGTYMTVSLMFWYVGLIPDLATIRDRATTRVRKMIYGFFALGWRGGQRQWRHYETAYLLLAGLSTPLVLSVHSIVSFDFAVSQIPGWHTTIFPPYFVAGAIFSGFAMVITLLVPARAIFGLHDLITPRHLAAMCKVILATGCMVGYAYAMEFFTAWYSGNPFESFVFLNNRLQGPYWWAYWTMVSCNVFAPQLFWFKRFRQSTLLMFAVCVFVNIGMWFERFVIIATSLSRDALPSSWDYYSPTWVEVLTFVGTFGIFLTLFLLFIRFLPMVAMAEVKSVMGHSASNNGRHAGAERVEGDPAPREQSVPKQRGDVSEVAGLVAEFDATGPLFKAAARVRREGYTRFDVHSPFPVHGLDEAMGLRRSRLGLIVLIGGITGVLFGFGLQWYASVMDYPLITGGKPYGSWPAFVPVIFEVGVLFAAFSAVGGMLVLNGLPNWYHPTLKHRRFMRASDDRYFLFIDASDMKFSREASKALLQDAGAMHVALLEP